jgi:hypothetical protein
MTSINNISSPDGPPTLVYASPFSRIIQEGPPPERRILHLFQHLAMASFPNIYTHRKVADTASKACEVCYKPSTSVLVTTENKVSHW